MREREKKYEHLGRTDAIQSPDLVKLTPTLLSVPILKLWLLVKNDIIVKRNGVGRLKPTWILS